MIKLRLLYRTARISTRAGFTLVELLVVIGIIAILAGVALGPITRGIKQAQENTSMQQTRQVGLMEFAYQNDNNQTYPFGAKSENIASTLLNANYASDPSVFYIANTPGASKGTGTAPYTLSGANVNFDFMVGSSTGLTSTASDGTPLVELTGASYTMATTGPLTATITTASAAFGSDGIAVSYKSNSAKFIKATVSTSTQATFTILDSSYSDTLAASYSLVVP